MIEREEQSGLTEEQVRELGKVLKNALDSAQLTAAIGGDAEMTNQYWFALKLLPILLDTASRSIPSFEGLKARLEQTAKDAAAARLMMDRLLKARDKDSWEEGETEEEARDAAWDARHDWGMCPSRTKTPEKVAEYYVAERTKEERP